MITSCKSLTIIVLCLSSNSIAGIESKNKYGFNPIDVSPLSLKRIFSTFTQVSKNAQKTKNRLLADSKNQIMEAKSNYNFITVFAKNSIEFLTDKECLRKVLGLPAPKIDIDTPIIHDTLATIHDNLATNIPRMTSL